MVAVLVMALVGAKSVVVSLRLAVAAMATQVITTAVPAAVMA
ncbi:hypothetical protein L584_15010 [Pantoea agglomerans Tx10]|nr:hypothetical protein L584_15010 [Pantoea agglomerans Tx10]